MVYRKEENKRINQEAPVLEDTCLLIDKVGLSAKFFFTNSSTSLIIKLNVNLYENLFFFAITS